MAARREEHWGSSVFCIFDFLKVIIRVNIYSCIVIAHNPCIVMVFYSYPPLSPPPPSSLFFFYFPTASSFHTSHFFIIFPFLFIHFILFIYLFIFSFCKSNTMLPSYQECIVIVYSKIHMSSLSISYLTYCPHHLCYSSTYHLSSVTRCKFITHTKTN